MSGFNWSETWRCVHTTLDYEDVRRLLSEDPSTRSMVAINDGDCGDVWGEVRRDGCRPHTTVWCHRFDIAAVIAVLHYADSLVGTDPNVWSEDQMLYKHETHTCVHTGGWVLPPAPEVTP